jgi:multimeric flavodoxin WrbA
MRITILNGEPDAASPFQVYLETLTNRLMASGHTVTKLDLRALDLKGCTGCWNCWVKTPGECGKRDNSETICRAALGADLLLLASPMTMGFTSALLKRAADQMVPLLHPYFVVEGGEIHHRARYAHYPVFALLLGAGPDSDAEDVELTRTMWGRMARNMKSRLAWTAIAEGNAEEVADVLTRVA